MKKKTILNRSWRDLDTEPHTQRQPIWTRVKEFGWKLPNIDGFVRVSLPPQLKRRMMNANPRDISHDK